MAHVDNRISNAFAGEEGILSSGAYEITAGPGASGTNLSSVPADFDPVLSYGETRRLFDSEFERRYVSWLLERHHGNISAAAREARMDRKHLHDLAKKHGFREPRGGRR